VGENAAWKWKWRGEETNKENFAKLTSFGTREFLCRSAHSAPIPNHEINSKGKKERKGKKK
jgi:hypothetical protein